MPERIVQVHTETHNKPEFVVAYDHDTYKIVTTPPSELIEEYFQDDLDSPFLLRKTGFSMEMQLLRWINKHNEAYRDGDLERTRQNFIQETVQDVISFHYEYQSGQDIFPINVEFVEDPNGIKTVYATKYHESLKTVNKNLELLTGQKERNGAMAEGVDTAIDIITTSENNVAVVILSPKGPSGIYQDGKEIIYPDHQMYVYGINNGGDLDAITIRSSTSLEASERMLGLHPKSDQSTKERIENVVRTPLRIKAESLSDALDLLENASGRKLLKQRNELTNRHDLFNLNEEASKVVNNLQSFLMVNITDLSRENIILFVTAVGKAILDLENLVLPPQEQHVAHQKFYTDVYEPNKGYIEMSSYQTLYDRVKQRKGCNGGGQTESFVPNTLEAALFGTNNVVIEGLGKYVKNCPCGAVIEDYISKGYICKQCGGTYEGC
jgi:hypothetical protein